MIVDVLTAYNFNTVDVEADGLYTSQETEKGLFPLLSAVERRYSKKN